MTENFSDTVCINHLYHLEQAISKIATCRWAGPGHPRHKRDEPLNLTINRLMPRVDWVIYYDFGSTKRGMNVTLPPKVHGRHKRRRRYRVAGYVGDLQRSPRDYLNHLNNFGYEALLMAYIKTGKHIVPLKVMRDDVYRYAINWLSPYHYIRGLQIPFYFTPPSIDKTVFRPLGLERIYDVTFLGAVHPDPYPLRQVIWNELPQLAKQMNWNILMRRSPIGASLDRKISKLIDGHFVGERYVKALNQSKIFIFSTSVFKYPLFKFPEAMACKALVMSDTPMTAEELHFIPDWNFVYINTENWKEKLKYYLKHDEERERIAQRGYETVMKYHTTDIRARQVVDFLRSVR